MKSNNFDTFERFRRPCHALIAVLLTFALLSAMQRAACASPITDFRLFGKSEVMVGVDSDVLSGKVGSFTLVHSNGGSGINFYGDLVSGGDIELSGKNLVHASMYAADESHISDGDSAVDGSIHANLANFTNASATGGVTVGGIVKYNSITAPQNCSTCTLVQGTPTPPDLPVFPAATSFTAGGPNQSNPGILAPGTYGAVSASNTLLTLSKGTYKMDSLSITNTGQLKFDVTNGPIVLQIVGDVSFTAGKDVTIVGGDETDVWAETHGDWTHAGGGTWYGSIFAPNGKIHIGSGSAPFNFHGVAWADIVDIEHSVTVEGGPPPPFGGIPEPSTMLMALVGAIGVGVLGRRKLGR